jgi:hypothetical protein
MSVVAVVLPVVDAAIFSVFIVVPSTLPVSDTKTCGANVPLAALLVEFASNELNNSVIKLWRGLSVEGEVDVG